MIKVIIAFIIALGVFRFIGYYFARKISKPIENLSEAAAEVAKGDLSKSVPVTTNDELGELATSFNKMVEGLREWERIKVFEFELEKGVGSALYMALFRSLLRVFAEQAAYCSGPVAAKIDQECGGVGIEAPENGQLVRLRAVPFTNNYIAQIHGEEGMFATLFFGVLDPTTGQLYYINGGHEPLYVINSTGVKTLPRPTGPAVGMMPNMPFSIQEIQLDLGDILVGYTDGVTEARSPEDEQFSRHRLQSLLEQPIGSVSDLLERIKSSLFSFIDIAPRHDDVTMLGVQRTPG